MKYFISAPFGNYLKLPNAISVTGSWTVEKREGLIPQIFKTLRYKNGGWINKIGLRNAGIYEGLKRTNSTDVLSLAAIDEYDWINLDRIVGKNLSVEINISCPNLDKDVGAVDLRGFDLFPKNNREWCICKIPPTATECLIDKIVDLGYNQIHASNFVLFKWGSKWNNFKTIYYKDYRIYKEKTSQCHYNRWWWGYK
jgi:dihydroorotate dehydrogenase